MGFNSTQTVLLNAVFGLLVMPVAGLLGAAFLNWSRLLLESRPISYWTAYKVTTLSSMAAVVFLVPAQLIAYRLGALGFVFDVVISAAVLGVFYARWIRDEDDQVIGLESGVWLSVIQSGLWLLLIGVFFGLGLAINSKQTALGVGIAIMCTALLVGVAALSMKGSPKTDASSKQVVSWKTEDVLALYRHANDELAQGKRDEELWNLARFAREGAEQQREWYLGERVKKMKEVAEDQLRREGII